MVSLAFISDEDMQLINKEHRGKDKTTNVLSFAFSEGDGPTLDVVPLGEILISSEKVKLDSKKNDRSFEEELIFVIIHGTLHLLGYDHMHEEEEKIMVEKEDKYLLQTLTKLGQS